MAALVLAVILFFLLVALRLLESRLHVGIGMKRQRVLPFPNRFVQLVHAVIRPAGEFRNVGIFRSHALGALQIVERLFVLAAPQVQKRGAEQDRWIFRRVDQRGALVRERMLEVAAR